MEALLDGEQAFLFAAGIQSQPTLKSVWPNVPTLNQSQASPNQSQESLEPALERNFSLEMCHDLKFQPFFSNRDTFSFPKKQYGGINRFFSRENALNIYPRTGSDVS